MTISATLALVVILTSGSSYTQETVAIMPADKCLVAMHQLWTIPADTAAHVDGFTLPTLDADCADPAIVDPVGIMRSGQN